MGTILNRDTIALSGLGIGAAFAAADTSAIFAAGGSHGGAFTGDGDVVSQTGTITARRAVASADARAARTAGGFHMGTLLNRDVNALSGTETTVTLAAADTCAALAAGGGHGGVFAGNGDGTAISAAEFVGGRTGVALAAADARAALAAGGGDGATGDGDVVGVAAICNGATDARAALAAGGGQAAGLTTPPPGGLVGGLVLKGQGVVFIGDIV